MLDCRKENISSLRCSGTNKSSNTLKSDFSKTLLQVSSSLFPIKASFNLSYTINHGATTIKFLVNLSFQALAFRYCQTTKASNTQVFQVQVAIFIQYLGYLNLFHSKCSSQAQLSNLICSHILSYISPTSSTFRISCA